jgi:predicted nucleotidyltransferase
MEVAAARQHFGTIYARLSESFLLSHTVQIGSHARGTAIRTHSDVDILAVRRR